MYLEELSCKNFRNYESLNIEFCPGINFITGPNGSGKTNILEAIGVCSNIKSFRNIPDQEMMQWSKDNYHCQIKARGYSHTVFEIGCAMYSGRLKKKAKLDGKEIDKLSDYYGRLLTVVFSPVDINIINGSPDIRRKFIDSVISKTSPDYLDCLNDFKRILSSRNKILKQLKERKINDTRQLDVFDSLFAEKSSLIISERESFSEQFEELFQKSYNEIAGDDEGPGIVYSSSLSSKNQTDIVNELLQNRSRDIAMGSSTVGPQRDELKLLNKENIRFTAYASQGQRRTAAISFKVSESIFLENRLSQKAVILVDDIFSELDEFRRANMVKILGRGNQVIFTMVNTGDFDSSSFDSTKIFFVDKEAGIKEV